MRIDAFFRELREIIFIFWTITSPLQDQTKGASCRVYDKIMSHDSAIYFLLQ
jgi:hypothetical protein